MGIPTGSPNIPKQTSESLADQLRKIGRPKDPKDRITFGKLLEERHLTTRSTCRHRRQALPAVGWA
jgi:hypothetical protein